MGDDTISKEFITMICEALIKFDDEAITDGEKEIVLRITQTLQENLQFE